MLAPFLRTGKGKAATLNARPANTSGQPSVLPQTTALMKKRIWIPGLLLLLVAITFFSGPKIPTPRYETALPQLAETPLAVAQNIRERESRRPVRDDNQARITWSRAPGETTEYSLVYLHGFGGSYRDGYPANAEIAAFLKANAYYARWGDHGLRPPHALVNFSAESAWEEAKEALAIGQKIGKKVIILSTSTGGTLALKLAAEYPEQVHALVNISPNVKDDMPGTWLLNSPWGAEIAALIGWGDGMRQVSHEEPGADQYFDTLFVAKALVDLQVLVSTTMQDSIFQKVTCPVQTLYYYKNSQEEDERVEVDVYPDLHAALGTPDNRKELTNLATPGTHFMGSSLKSKDTRAVTTNVIRFLTEQAGVNRRSSTPSRRTTAQQPGTAPGR